MRGFLAALMTLTRLPLWRVITLDKKYFCDTLLYWHLVGIIKGGTTAVSYRHMTLQTIS